jgi:hypothetical protein
MTDSNGPHSPFAGKLDFSARTPVRAIPLDEIEQMLAAHRLYLETERRQGSRADFGSADLSGHDFSGLDLRRPCRALPRTPLSRRERGSGEKSPPG